MRQALHIFRKDLRRGWPLLLLWGALLAAWTTQAWRDPLLAESLEKPVDFTMLLVVAALVGVSLVVHQEPLIGTSAFWMTRPFRPGALLAAKAAFVLVFLGLAPLALQMALAARFGLPAEQWPAALIECGLPWLALIATAFAIAALTSNTLTYVVAVVACWVLLLSYGLSATHGYDPLDSGVTLEDRVWRSLGFCAVACLVAGVVAFHQYRARRTAGSIGFAVAGLALGVLVPRNFGDDAQRSIEGSANLAHASVMLAPPGARVLFPAYRPGPLARSPLEFWAGARPDSLPPGHDLEIIALLGEVKWDNAQPTRFAAPMSWFAREGVQHAAGGFEWFAGLGIGRIGYSLQLRGPGRFEDYFARTGSLATESSARLWRIEPAARIPVELGARASGPSWAAVIQRLEREDGKLRIGYRLRQARTALWPAEPPRLLLVNRERGEMLASRVEVWRSGQDYGRLITGPQIRAEDRIAEFMTRFGLRDGEPFGVDDAWLAGAELLFLHYVPVGRLTATVHADPVAFEEEQRPGALSELRPTP